MVAGCDRTKCLISLHQESKRNGVEVVEDRIYPSKTLHMATASNQSLPPNTSISLILSNFIDTDGLIHS